MTRADYDVETGRLDGVQLVEASAGTGKTYTIAGVFVRLVAEQGLGVGEILVVTFTEAATEELRDRVRRRLRDALVVLDTGDAGEDTFLAGLLQRTPDREAARERLLQAVRCFDEAAIFTIHGFCQRVLQENAFECGSLFEAEIAVDEGGLLEECVADYRRRTLHEASPYFLRYLQGVKASFSDLVDFAGNYASAPGLDVLPATEPFTGQPGGRAVAEAYQTVQELWRAERDAVVSILRDDPGINRRAYGEAAVAGMIAEMDGYVAGGDPQAVFERFERFTGSYLGARIKKNHECPQHQFFPACEALQESLAALEEECRAEWLAFQRELLEYVGEELPARKARQHVRSFDDLMVGVRDALDSPVGDRLAATLRQRYRAALIDEFQDTDPVQYGIFHRLFAGEGARLFLIGDPKQAIYAFRGADVFTYMRAAAASERQYTLRHNYRSTPELLQAVNALFERPNPFLFEQIPYEPVTSGAPDKKLALAVGGVSDPSPLRVWHVERTEGEKVISKGDAWDTLPGCVAGEIVALLTGEGERAVTIGDTPRPEDVAVLVRTNVQARRIQDALVARGVPSVIYSAESLFASREAREVLRWIAALAEPTSEARVRAALATDLLGLDGAELDRVRHDDVGWDRWLQAFHGAHARWRERGFVAAARWFLAEHGVRERLLRHVDGERRLTNVLHCVEVLQRAAAEDHYGPEGLVSWLGRKIEEHDDAEEYQVRLETDERAVKVVTIHKSKGLEYPVVFCPFAWEGLRQAKDGEAALLHDPADDRRLVLDLGSEDLARHTALARREALAERLRHLYVALTRAKQRCTVVWGGYRGVDTAALGYLLHAAPDAGDGEPGAVVERIAADLGELPDERILEGLDALAERSGGTVRVEPLPEPAPGRYTAGERGADAFAAASAPAGIDTSWGLASFSGFTARAAHAERPEGPGPADEPDRDQGLTPEPAPGEAPEEPVGDQTIFAFPRGAGAGSCWHEIFEVLDFTDPDPEAVQTVVRERLRRHGFPDYWEPEVSAMVRRVLGAPVLEGAPDFRLAQLGWGDRLVELEFHLAAAHVDPTGLAAAIGNAGAGGGSTDLADRVGRLGFRGTRGLLKGFIDLVFRHAGRYTILDWKSNHLGNTVADYAPERLAEAVRGHHYDLQYLLYTVALHRYLGQRLPGYDYDRHVGGALYLFVRGVDPEVDPACGIHRDRLPRALVEALDRYLRGEDAHAL